MIDPIDAYVGKKLKERRSTLGLSQVTLAHLLGTSFQQVQKYEKGTSRLHASTLHALAVVLKVEVDYFFEGIEETQSLCVHPEEGGEGKELIHYWQTIPNTSQRKTLFELIRALVVPTRLKRHKKWWLGKGDR